MLSNDRYAKEGYTKAEGHATSRYLYVILYDYFQFFNPLFRVVPIRRRAHCPRARPYSILRHPLRFLTGPYPQSRVRRGILILDPDTVIGLVRWWVFDLFLNGEILFSMRIVLEQFGWIKNHIGISFQFEKFSFPVHLIETELN